GLPGDGVYIIGQALLAGRHRDALGIRPVTRDRPELGGEIFLTADALAWHPGIEEIGPVAHHDGNAGLECDRLFEPPLADEAPGTHCIGDDIDRQRLGAFRGHALLLLYWGRRR